MGSNQSVSGIYTTTPGKILLCGGYLIINPNYPGLVFTTDTLFQCESKLFPLEGPLPKEDDKTFFTIIVNSVDFKQFYTYDVTLKYCNEKGLLFFSLDEKENSDGKFIYNSIKSAIYIFFQENYDNIELNIKLIKEKLDNKCLVIKIHSEYRFYTYNKEKFGEEENKTFNIKTGLGSSSALVCSLVTNIYILFSMLINIIEPNENKISVRELPKERLVNIHVASYFANNLAQNKIGSGFDIQTCLFGSHVFRDHTIRHFKSLDFEKQISVINYANHRIYTELCSKYELDVPLLNIPEFLKSCIISVERGSDTREMVGKVLQWADEHMTKERFDDQYFQNLNKSNLEIIEIFRDMSINNITEEEFYQMKLNDKLKEKCLELRKKLKALTKASETDIEPDELTTLLDRLLEEKNILFAVIPGAGGYDGVFVLGVGQNFQDVVHQVLSNLNSVELKLQAHFIPIEITNIGTTFTTILNK